MPVSGGEGGGRNPYNPYLFRSTRYVDIGENNGRVIAAAGNSALVLRDG